VHVRSWPLSVPAPVLIRQRNLTFTHLRPSSPHSNSAGRSHRRLGRACAMRLSKASEFGRDSAKGQSRRRALRPQSRRRRFLTWFPFRSLLSTVSTSVPIHHHGTALAHSSICRPRHPLPPPLPAPGPPVWTMAENWTVASAHPTGPQRLRQSSTACCARSMPHACAVEDTCPSTAMSDTGAAAAFAGAARAAPETARCVPAPIFLRPASRRSNSRACCSP